MIDAQAALQLLVEWSVLINIIKVQMKGRCLPHISTFHMAGDVPEYVFSSKSCV